MQRIGVLGIVWRVLTAAALMAATTASGEQHAALVSPPVLTIYEASAPDSDAPTWVLDIAALKALPVDGFETQTIWTTGPQRFDGVRLNDLLAHLGIEGGTLTLMAVNDYAVTIPLSDATSGAALIAYEWNGKEMTLRDKGPLWLVYPYEADPAYRTETIYSRSIWQLDRMVVSR